MKLTIPRPPPHSSHESAALLHPLDGTVDLSRAARILASVPVLGRMVGRLPFLADRHLHKVLVDP